MTDFLDAENDPWLSGATEETEQPPAETVEAPVTEPQPVTEPEAVTPQAEPETKSDPHSVPYSAMKEEREKRQAAERELEALRGQATRPQQPAVKVPDPYEQPEEYTAHIQGQIAQAKWEIRAEMSGERAEGKYGKPTVDDAMAWYQAEVSKDPLLGQKVIQQPSPVEYVVQQFQQSKTLETIAGRPFEDAAKDYAIQQGWIVSPEANASTMKPSPSTPTRSLSTAAGNGGVASAPKAADWAEVKFPLG